MFLERCDDHGGQIKWFVGHEPVGFTSAHGHWRYIDATTNLPCSDEVLQGLCDFRLPSSLTEEDCRTLAAVVREAMEQVTGGGQR